MEHGAVVYGAGLGGRAAPIGARCAALQERETVGVEEIAAVSRERGEIVRDAAVDGAEAGQQAGEGVVAAFEHLFAQAVGSLAKLVVQGGDGAAGFESAAWRSAVRGVTWKRVPGFDFKWAHRVIADPQNRGQIYITTFGGSVWRGKAD
jgi:hypothetical protein